MCTMPIVTWLIPGTSHGAHICVCILAYMPNSIGIFVSSTYLAIIRKVFIVPSCVLALMCKMLGLYIHLFCGMCDLDMQCSCSIC